MARRRAEKDQLGRKEFFRLMEKMIGAGSPERDEGLMEGVMVCAAKSFIEHVAPIVDDCLQESVSI